MSTTYSELNWKAADYEKRGLEAPPMLVAEPTKCEAELMSNEDVQEYVRDCVATLRVLGDAASPKFDDVQKAYLADIAVLHAFGRIDSDAYNELRDDQLLRF